MGRRGVIQRRGRRLGGKMIKVIKMIMVVRVITLAGLTVLMITLAP
jgi:hypothetical protein